MAKQNEKQKMPSPNQGGGMMQRGNQFGSGGWLAFPVQFPFVPFPAWGSPHTPPVGAGNSQLPIWVGPTWFHIWVGPTWFRIWVGPTWFLMWQGRREEEDYLELLDEEEALELVQFEPVVDEDDAWKACDTIITFIKKNFNQVISTTTRDGIMKDYPKPKIEALFGPKLDEDVKKQIEKAGKDPHYGVEKHLYNLQKQILDISGPLTCLWADLLNRDAGVNPKDVILLLQSTLTLLGSASHTITQERRRVALSRINSTIGTLPEDTEENQEKVKETTLFGGGFIEKATKRIEEQKALAKVVGTRNVPPYKRQQSRDPNDLHRFLQKGAPAKCGGRNNKRPQPYPPKFQKRDQRKGRFPPK